jgi:hypothetical protein
LLISHLELQQALLTAILFDWPTPTIVQPQIGLTEQRRDGRAPHIQLDHGLLAGLRTDDHSLATEPLRGPHKIPDAEVDSSNY